MATDRETQLLATAYAAGLTSQKELANFMAQVSHESGGLARLNESFRYSKGPQAVSAKVRSALREGPEALNDAWKEAMQGRPERLAELMYGGRMGNDEPGDGYKYRGRGYIQLTGKDQYRAAGEALGMDLVGRPDLAADPENAARIAVWYWKQNVHERGGAAESPRIAGSIINTGSAGNTPNGLADRERRFTHWERHLTPDVMRSLANGSLGATVGEPVRSPAAREAAGRAETVTQAQATLVALGYLGRNGQPLAQDGVSGANTDHAIRQFQAAHGLKVDGIAGPRTQSAMEHAAQHPLLSESRHPSHGLYRAIAEQLPAGTDRRTIANITMQAQENGISTPRDLRGVHVNGNDVWVLGNGPDPAASRVRVDLQAPTADLQSTSDHVARQASHAQAESQQQQQQAVQMAIR